MKSEAASGCACGVQAETANFPAVGCSNDPTTPHRQLQHDAAVGGLHDVSGLLRIETAPEVVLPDGRRCLGELHHGILKRHCHVCGGLALPAGITEQRHRQTAVAVFRPRDAAANCVPGKNTGIDQ